VFLYAFDLLELDGRDLRRKPIEARKHQLATLRATPASGCNSTSTSPSPATSFFASSASKVSSASVWARAISPGAPAWHVGG
jgi:ATP-dependent DNA ligase